MMIYIKPQIGIILISILFLTAQTSFANRPSEETNKINLFSKNNVSKSKRLLKERENKKSISKIDRNEDEKSSKINNKNKVESRKSKRGGVYYIVEKGVTLWQISKAYNISLNRIKTVNKIQDSASLRSGAKIFIPGVDKVIQIIPPPPCLNKEVSFLRVSNNEETKIVLTYCNGKIYEKGLEQFSHIARSLKSSNKEIKLLNPRLINLMQKIADHYPGKRIEIISGYRGPKPGHENSPHIKGKAIDFKVSGVPKKVLCDYIRTFSNVGVGYYPNTSFVHLDVRDRNAFWVDWSSSGEMPRYGSIDHDPFEDIIDERESKLYSEGDRQNKNSPQKISDKILKIESEVDKALQETFDKLISY